MPSTTDLNLQHLLAHAQWLRRLASLLARDEDAAQDALQDTWEAGLRHPPEAERPARPWLLVVLRNALRGRARRESRRLLREQSVVSNEPQTSVGPDEAIERIELQRKLAALVTALEEPFRSAIILRFFEGLSGVEIARKLGVPEGTVRWRLHEALRRLRAGLDEEYGGDRLVWCALVAPWRGPLRPPEEAASAGSVLTTATIGVAALVSAALLLGAVMSNRDNRNGATTGDARARPVGAPPRMLAAPGIAAPDEAMGSIEGSVIDPSGRPVPEAEISVYRRFETGPTIDDIRFAASARTGKNGRFRVGNLPSGGYHVIARAAPLAAAHSFALLAAPGISRTELLLGLAPVPLRGRVVDAEGLLIPEADVFAVGQHGLRERRVVFPARSGADGRFSLALLPERYVVWARKDGYAVAVESVNLSQPQAVDIHLPHAVTVSGRIVDAAGNAVSGARVWIAVDGKGNPGPRAVESDARGWFAIVNVGAGVYRVNARAGGSIGMSDKVHVADEDRGEVIVRVNPGRIVTGRVVDTKGVPIRGARVQVGRGRHPGEPPWPESHLATDATGGFRSDPLFPGEYSVMAETDEHSPVRLRTDLIGSEVQDVTLALQPGVRAAGIVLSADGEAVSNALVRVRVFAQNRGGISNAWRSARTGQDGRFEVTGLPPGPLTISAHHREEVAVWGPVDVPAGTAKNETLTLARPGAVTGTVRLANGTRVPNATVGAHADNNPLPIPNVRADAEGRYEITGLAPGYVVVAASGGPHPRLLIYGMDADDRRNLQLAPGERRADVDLIVARPGEEIRGRVLDVHGRPAAGADIAAGLEEPGFPPVPGLAASLRTVTDLDGAFVLSELASGSYTVWAIKPGAPEAVLGGLVPGRPEVVLRFALPGRVSGTVVDERGRPVSGYSIGPLPVPTAQETPELRRRRELNGAFLRPPAVVSDPNGAFTIDRLSPGEHQLLATTPAGARGTTTVSVGAGETTSGTRIILRDPARQAR